MNNLPDIISKPPEDVTDEEFRELEKAMNITNEYLETLRRSYWNVLRVEEDAGETK